MTPSDQPTVTAAPVIPTFVATGFTKAWRQGFVAPGGYTETISLSVGLPQHVGATYPRQVATGKCDLPDPAKPGSCQRYATAPFIGGKTCTVNSATDAVVAIDSTQTSTTVNFPEIVGERMTFSYSPHTNDSYLGMSRSLQYEASYRNTGATCTQASFNSLQESSYSVDPVSSGQSSSTPIFLIIPNYYTPDHPSGDPAVLAGVVVSVSGSSNSTLSWASDNQGISYQVSGSAATTLPANTAIRLG